MMAVDPPVRSCIGSQISLAAAMFVGVASLKATPRGCLHRLLLYSEPALASLPLPRTMVKAPY